MTVGIYLVGNLCVRPAAEPISFESGLNVAIRKPSNVLQCFLPRDNVKYRITQNTSFGIIEPCVIKLSMYIMHNLYFTK